MFTFYVFTKIKLLFLYYMHNIFVSHMIYLLLFLLRNGLILLLFKSVSAIMYL